MKETYKIIFIGRMISLPFLVLTLLHFGFSTKFRVLYKKCLMNYLIILIITNVFSILALILNYEDNHPKYIEHIYGFISMTTILWTNVLCYDFWQRIKNFMPYNDSKGETRMYIKCSIYVWLCSFLHSIVCFIADHSLNSWWIYCPIKYILFIIPCIVLLCNVSMMIHATIIIIKETQSNKILSGPDTFNNNVKHKKKQRLYFKLIAGTTLLVTSNWFWFSLSDLLGQTKSSESTSYKIFEYAVVMNSYQGLFIFTTFTLKKKIFLALKNKFSDLFSEHTILSDLNINENTQNGEKIANSIKEEDQF